MGVEYLLHIKKLNLDEIREIYNAYMHEAFPPSELRPFASMEMLYNKNCYPCYGFYDETGSLCAYAYFSCTENGKYALLDYFAVLPQRRGMGAGSSALKLLLNRYADKRLLLEIESTKKEASNSEQRLRRKAFYTANGMAALDYCVDLFGVEMEILTYRCDVSFEEYHSIFENVFSPRAAKNVKLIK